MKISLTLILLFISTLVSAEHYLQLGAGSITPHFSSSKKNYCNQWNDTGIIVNKTYYIRYLSESYGITYMQGNDSICSPIEGIFIHYLFSRSDDFEVGIAMGGYAYEANNWEEHAKDTPEDIDAPEPVHMKFGGRDVVPVLALDVAVTLIRGDGWKFKLNNLLTPIIFNHSVALEFQF